MSVESSTTYPTLAEMGIIRFHEISHYSLRQDAPDKDTLRINYKRAKGSFLPYSRKYKFGRSTKTVVADGGTARMEHVHEISPFLLKAITELDTLIAVNQLETSTVPNTDLKEDLVLEINELTTMLEGGDAAVLAKLSSVRKQIESL